MPHAAKRALDDDIVSMLEIERKLPDIMGNLTGSSLHNLLTIVAEVKKGPLKFKDLYQIKLYADLLIPDYAFLIAVEGFSEARKRFIKTHPYLLHYGADIRLIQVTRLVINGEGNYGLWHDVSIFGEDI